MEAISFYNRKEEFTMKTSSGDKNIKLYRSIKKGFWPYIFIVPYIVLYAAFSLFPILYSFVISLTSWEGIGEKTFIGFKNYITIFTQDPYFFKSVLNTGIIMLLSTPIVIILGLVIANLLFGMVKGRSFFQTVNFLPYITTPVAIGLIFSFLFDWRTGIVNGILKFLSIIPEEGINWLGDAGLARVVLALLIIWKYLGYHIVVYLSGLSSISPELYEAAKVDGSSGFNTFFKITVPLLRPVTVFLIITDLIGGLQMFDEPVQLLSGWGQYSAGGPGRSCLTAVWYFYDVTFKSTSRLGYGSAVAYSLFLIIIVVSVIGFKITEKKEENA